MSDGAHLLIPFASATAPGAVQALRDLALPNLEKLLARLSPGARDEGGEATLSMPHERALARACGLSFEDGRIPLAAWQLRQSGGDAADKAWAWITPCHWRVGRDHVAMGDPAQLALPQADSQALLAAMQPFFAEDGIELTYDTPLRWLAQGEVFRELPTASLDRVSGQTLDSWMPRKPQGGTLRRLQQEMQMLLYTASLNDARQARGQLPVNSLWVSGTGPLTGPGAPTAQPQVNANLRGPALRDDWPAWEAAWHLADSTLAAGAASRITLCGERSARTWSAGGTRSLAQRLGAVFRRPQLTDILESL
jgi:hypothetical protein